MEKQLRKGPSNRVFFIQNPPPYDLKQFHRVLEYIKNSSILTFVGVTSSDMTYLTVFVYMDCEKERNVI